MSKLTFYSILATIGVFVFIGLIIAVALFAFPIFRVIIIIFCTMIEILITYSLVKDVLKNTLGVKENDDCEV